MPQGLPAPGDTGLGGAWELPEERRWARVYWGGALYFLLADVSIRERTAGKRSLRDALAAVARKGGGASFLSVEEVIRVGDSATGTAVLRELYDRLALAPGTEDLEGLWRRLGVRSRPPSVELDDSAPLAAIRSEITAFR